MTYTDVQRREAAEWFVIIRETEVPTAATVQRWLKWMEACEEHRLAFEAVERAWHQTEALDVTMPSAREIREDEYDGEMPVAEWRARPSFRYPRPLLAAAAIAAIALFSQPALQLVTPAGAKYKTGVAEQLEIALADGSHVTLGAKSRLSVQLTEQRRDLRLKEGEAFFVVHQDKNRPFTVHAGKGSITAIGTAFNVRASRDDVTVAVSEGAVKVVDLDPKTERQVRSGQQVTYGARVLAADVAASDVQTPRDRSRWREGWLVYRNEPLKKVIEDIGRYTDKRVEIQGEEAGQLRFSGAVNRQDIEEWLRALPESFPLTLEHGNEKEYRFSAERRLGEQN